MKLSIFSILVKFVWYFFCRYREVTDPKIKPFTGNSPIMGIHLGLRGPEGVVNLGDPVFVNESEVK